MKKGMICLATMLVAPIVMAYMAVDTTKNAVASEPFAVEAVVCTIPEPVIEKEETPSEIAFEAVEEPKYVEGVLTKRGGVNYFNGHKETWYSSDVLRHYRIDEWTAGEDGIWRDSDGYIVVAMDCVPMESIVETSLGTAKVYDRVSADGSRPEIVDIYTKW